MIARGYVVGESGTGAAMARGEVLRRVGLAVGGLFLTPVLRVVVARHAVPADRPWRRGCDHCGATLRYPWLSPAFLPAGRCGTCGLRVAAPAYAVEVVVVVALGVLVLVDRPVWQSAAIAWWSLCAVALVFVDAAVHRLPDRLTYPAAAGTLALLGVAALVEDQGDAWLRAVTAGVGVGAVFAALTFVLGRCGPGLGDAKLLVSTMFLLGWIGWPAVLAGLFLGFTAQAVWGIALLVARRATRTTLLPLGPFLAGGALAAVALLG